MSSHAFTSWLPCGLLLCACSLMGLDEVNTISCEGNAPCALLNEGREGECEQYVCHESGNGCVLGTDFDGDGVDAVACAQTDEARAKLDCDDQDGERHPKKLESGNGVDDDCDHVIDEGAAIEVVKLLELLEPGVGTLQHVAYAVDEGALVLACSGGDGNALYRVPLADEAEARGALLKTCLTGTDCQAKELALARAGDAWLLGALHTSGCEAGKLQLGTIDADALSAPALQRSGGECAAASEGVDLTDASPLCTGASRSDGTRGLARLAVASQAGDDEADALFGYIADTVDREACGGAPVSIELTRSELLEVPQIALAAPRAIGNTIGGGAPAIVSWPGRGYFVAHGDESGDLALAFAAAGPSAESCREVAPLEAAALTPIEAHDADHVALALGRITSICDDADVELALAYQEGCGGDGALRFTRAGFTLDSGELCVAGEPQLIAEGSASGERLTPQLAHAPRANFVTPDFERSGQQASDSRGGFVVTFVAEHDGRDTLFAHRLWEHDGKLIGNEPFVLSTTEQTPRFPFLIVDGPNVSVCFYDAESDSFLLARLSG